jgi:hypothetical protein
VGVSPPRQHAARFAAPHRSAWLADTTWYSNEDVFCCCCFVEAYHTVLLLSFIFMHRERERTREKTPARENESGKLGRVTLRADAPKSNTVCNASGGRMVASYVTAKRQVGKKCHLFFFPSFLHPMWYGARENTFSDGAVHVIGVVPARNGQKKKNTSASGSPFTRHRAGGRSGIPLLTHRILFRLHFLLEL